MLSQGYFRQDGGIEVINRRIRDWNGTCNQANTIAWWCSRIVAQRRQTDRIWYHPQKDTNLSWDAWLTLGVVAGLLLALVRNLGPPDALFLGAVAVLAWAGVLTPAEAFAGFSNPGMLTVAFLFVVAAALRETGCLDWLGQQVLGKAQTQQALLLRLAGVVVPLSAFLNNTPLVAMFVPIVLSWSRRFRISPSRLLIPLSYLAILGGTCTLLGTSTNLVINGLLLDAGLAPMSLFELTPIGIPYAFIGMAYLYFIGPRLLPDRKELLEQLGESRREYLVERQVALGSLWECSGGVLYRKTSHK